MENDEAGGTDRLNQVLVGISSCRRGVDADTEGYLKRQGCEDSEIYQRAPMVKNDQQHKAFLNENKYLYKLKNADLIHSQ